MGSTGFKDKRPGQFSSYLVHGLHELALVVLPLAAVEHHDDLLVGLLQVSLARLLARVRELEQALKKKN